MIEEASSTVALWWSVIAIGIYHGVNPGMGWPLAVSSALMERKPRALPLALAALAMGHFVSMVLILLPFSLMTLLIRWEQEIRIAAAIAVIAMGLILLVWRRHPRFLSRVPPSKLALWSGLAALAHGAGLMLVPMYLGICETGPEPTAHDAAITLMATNFGTALLVAGLHTAAMITAGGALAVGVYLWLGIRVLSRTWFNLDLVWALSLVLVGGFGLYDALRTDGL